MTGEQAIAGSGSAEDDVAPAIVIPLELAAAAVALAATPRSSPVNRLLAIHHS